VVLYYALGGGLGHLTRARRVLAALGCGDRAAVLTASPFAGDPRVCDGLPVVRVPPRLGHDRGVFRGWLSQLLAELGPDELIVDSFPGGILGELCGIAVPRARHVARRLRWGAYAQRLDGRLPRYEITHVLEPLDRHHVAALEGYSRGVEPFELPAPFATGESLPLSEKPHWLVVHSGPEAEVAELVQRAADLRWAARASVQIIVVSPSRPSRLPGDSDWRDIYPVAPFLPHAQRILTAAGFNVMHETVQLGDRHHFFPYPRALDDQFARAAARTEARRRQFLFS
jgi:hypothetical protein